MCLPSDGFLQSLTDLSSNNHIENGFSPFPLWSFTQKPWKTWGKAQSSEVGRKKRLTYLLNRSISSSYEKSKSQWCLWGIPGNKGNSPVEIKGWFSRSSTHLWEISSCDAKMQETKEFPSLYKAHCFATRNTSFFWSRPPDYFLNEKRWIREIFLIPLKHSFLSTLSIVKINLYRPWQLRGQDGSSWCAKMCTVMLNRVFLGCSFAG